MSIRYIMLWVSLLLSVACSSSSSEWEMVEVIAIEERIETESPQEFYVCNCYDVAVSETSSCTFEKNVTYGGQIGINVGAGVSISGSVLRGLGEVDATGHSVHLQPPIEPNHVLHYQIIHQKFVQEGEALFRSIGAADSDQLVAAPFQREQRCRVNYRVIDQISCVEAETRGVSCAIARELPVETLSIDVPVTEFTPDMIETPALDFTPTPVTVDPSLVLLGQTTNEISHVDWSNDGQYAVLSNRRGEIKVWNVDKQLVTHFLNYHSDAILQQISWSPDGRYWAGGDEAGRVSIWDGQTGLVVAQWQAHTGLVSDLAWSPDSHYLATGGTDRVIHIWEALTGQKTKELRGHDRAISALAWAPDGRHLISAGLEAGLLVWEWSSDNPPQRMTGHAGSVSALSWAPNGLWLVSGDNDGQIGLWYWQNGVLQSRGMHNVAQHRILSLAWSPNSQLIAFNSLVQMTQVKSIDFQDVAFPLRQLTVGSLGFSSDGKSLLLGTDQGHLYKWPFSD